MTEVPMKQVFVSHCLYGPPACEVWRSGRSAAHYRQSFITAARKYDDKVSEHNLDF